ncbi:MAG: S41 family peptidase [Gemmataceae bacterium]
MPRWNLVWLVGVPFTILLALAIGYGAPPLRGEHPDAELVRILVDVLGEVDRSYVRELDDAGRRKLVEDMINGGLERLDPHSTFFNAYEYRQFDRKSEGKFGGIGIQVSQDRTAGTMTVTAPMVGTPAYEAGILAGDRIVKIDGRPLDILKPDEAIDLIQGDPGTIVTLTIERGGSPSLTELTITRAIVEIETVLGDRRNPLDPKEWEFTIDGEANVALIRLTEFDKPTAPTLKQVLDRLDATGVRGLVLDLRGNPGGLLVSSVEIADLFLADGKVVSTRGRKGNEKVYTARKDGTPFERADRPIAVLTDRYSASASEIVAAALQDHDRAVVVGERTYGKGSVQEIYTLANHSVALKLTTQSYWRPSGKNIHRFPDSNEADDWGVRPSAGFAVELSEDERRVWAAARRARDVVRGKGNEQPAGPPIIDKVLDRALSYVRGELAKRN